MIVNKPGVCSIMLLHQLSDIHRESISPLLKETQRAVFPFISVCLKKPTSAQQVAAQEQRVASVSFLPRGDVDKNKRLHKLRQKLYKYKWYK